MQFNRTAGNIINFNVTSTSNYSDYYYYFGNVSSSNNKTIYLATYNSSNVATNFI